MDPPFAPLDTDPHVSRVVRFLRPSDVAAWAASAAALPAGLFALEHVNPTRPFSAARLRVGYRVAAAIGAIGGFLLAYQRSSMRLWGWRENARERELYVVDIRAALRAGRSVHGEETSRLTPYMQRIAANNSRFAATKMDVIPWFNVVRHPHHGEHNARMVQAVAEEMAAGQ